MFIIRVGNMYILPHLTATGRNRRSPTHSCSDEYRLPGNESSHI